MKTYNSEILSYFLNLNLISIIDILVALTIIWQVLNFLGKTRGLQIAKGLVFLYIFKGASAAFGMRILSELFDSISTLLLISLPIVFQREIRIMLENFGRISLHKKNSLGFKKVINEIRDALKVFTKEKVGALIILERTTPLDEFTSNGIILGSELSTELLECIFKNQSTLHDGATLIRNGKVFAAKCILPLSESTETNSNLGTRHRAAIGVTEVTDAIAIVVSEETGYISVAHGGNLTKVDKIDDLEKIISDVCSTKLLNQFN